ncbi:AAA family ATPase [Methylomonas sp. MED-D]|uniref:AAA family ATPase n=1 Tax=Methylomonas sp. MED-D TaxID=3418768 RepID=UPI003D0599C5
MDFIPVKPQIVELASTNSNLPLRHQFELRQIKAINAALSAQRPLLVRGEPGVGKSQLARAAAKVLGRMFVQHVVDARTESRDLLWHFDAVGRLAKAQIMGALTFNNEETALKTLEDELAVAHFLHPGALWWAFDWHGALQQAESVQEGAPPNPDAGDPANGSVVLIDEIDKAESDVPNGLLEALGNGEFTPQGLGRPVKADGPPPLVVITTNEERTLPDAFIRRCLVLHLDLPKDRDKLIAKLVARGKAHFGEQTTAAVLNKAAELLAQDRAEAEQRHWRPLPGQAEYLDLLRAVVTLARGKPKQQQRLIDEVARFVLKKHPEAAQSDYGDDA